MTDRFKFRAWNPERNEFIYNIQDVGSDFSIRCWEDCFGDFLFNEDYIIEQCTGLKDKNGKLIYEGDIVKYTTGLSDTVLIGFVFFNNNLSAFCIKDNTDCYPPLGLFGDAEVIGNVHENPELMED